MKGPTIQYSWVGELWNHSNIWILKYVSTGNFWNKNEKLGKGARFRNLKKFNVIPGQTVYGYSLGFFNDWAHPSETTKIETETKTEMKGVRGMNDLVEYNMILKENNKFQLKEKKPYTRCLRETTNEKKDFILLCHMVFVVTTSVLLKWQKI